MFLRSRVYLCLVRVTYKQAEFHTLMLRSWILGFYFLQVSILLILNSWQEDLKHVAYDRQRYNSLDMFCRFMHRCKCGNCSVIMAQNISECYCCKELEECGESLESDLVKQDVSPNASLTCVTEHPGFNPVCLQKWSLRMAASKFKTKGKQQYRQRGSEERLVETFEPQFLKEGSCFGNKGSGN